MWPKLAFQYVDDLTPENMSPELISELKNHLKLQRTFYSKLHQKTMQDRDDEWTQLAKSKNVDFGAAQKQFKNEALADLVMNKTELKKIDVYNGRFIQLNNPVYRDADGLRGHFFAPRKKVFGQYFNTFTVNIAVIWFMTLSLIILLFFDGLRKALNLFNR